MATNPTRRTHRASAQRRRAALLDAARELIGEVGAGAVTHRAVAARAGVPLSTTSYFFDSIDDLVSEALLDQSHFQTQVYDSAERTWVLQEGEPPGELLEQIADQLAQRSLAEKAAAIETFLAAGREPDQAEALTSRVTRFQERLTTITEQFGATNPGGLAWAFLAHSIGSTVHQVGGVTPDSEQLAYGLKLLMAASLLDNDELDELLSRVRNPATTKLPEDLAPDHIAHDN